MHTFLLLCISFAISLILVPIFIRLAKKFGFVDYPNYRKVHTVPMPYLGGVAILVSFTIVTLFSQPAEMEYKPIIIGAAILCFVGLVDDKYDLKPMVKFIGQLVAIGVPIYYGIIIDTITPFGIEINFGVLSVLVTVIWMAAIINAINLIDGLDGLATGVVIIALASIAVITIFQSNIFVMMICIILIGSLLGFLPYNFHPAKIFLGDNGSMMLGYIVGVLSIIGFKNITFISLFFPIIILGVPFIDMFFAVIRRFREGVSVMRADKNHLHHRIRHLGFSHRESVVLIYFIALLFAIGGVVMYLATVPGAIIIGAMLLLTTNLVVEATNLIGSNKRPLLNFFKKIFDRIP
ncbi:glycosyltransferase family 4 protein [Jeotgalicoccus meleagridis]|uniref:Putative undecaprenyl-phosphate N-acetylglucosaminyl 1-phosphate transferase n=1 Tax=Jeotgalicoccus meleagridis TaxID=2759181 RepID=A0A6V7RQV3_9STAP|nr:MraY family glycosyltransferase [Jeotgalicoccus meleagridis]CAD2080297.1 putative undecaprenyl-phosphate N-acetylglucosaminyl 1-phosphate transferase [Jeotgalicoccus meleagridis]HIW38183.1 undecaprenyl/decaprenyl-phosphate alpha-N-acetylglucosaminyl 1-phosphate transferase [Candidatus Jeotgalicoccus stercoravium]